MKQKGYFLRISEADDWAWKEFRKMAIDKGLSALDALLEAITEWTEKRKEPEKGEGK